MIVGRALEQERKRLADLRILIVPDFRHTVLPGMKDLMSSFRAVMLM
jgi:hypothetical protein